jgi:hypothetical protein
VAESPSQIPESTSDIKNLTRKTTQAERDLIESIEVNAEDLERFMEQFRQGLLTASQGMKHAVQDAPALRADVSIRISRPVLSDSGDFIENLVDSVDIAGQINANKKYKE